MYLDHLTNDPDGYRPTREGQKNPALYHVCQAMRPLLALFARSRVADIGLRELRVVRDSICRWDRGARQVVHHEWWNDHTKKEDEGRPKPWAAETINRRMRYIIRMFYWLEK